MKCPCGTVIKRKNQSQCYACRTAKPVKYCLCGTVIKRVEFDQCIYCRGGARRVQQEYLPSNHKTTYKITSTPTGRLGCLSLSEFHLMQKLLEPLEVADRHLILFNILERMRDGI